MISFKNTSIDASYLKKNSFFKGLYNIWEPYL